MTPIRTQRRSLRTLALHLFPVRCTPRGRTITLSPTLSLDVRRDDIIHVESLYDASPFGDTFGPVARLFDTFGMNTVSDNIPRTETQEEVLRLLHEALSKAADGVTKNLPTNPLLPSLPLRSLDDREMVNPLVTLGSLIPVTSSDPLSKLLSDVGIGPNPTSMTESQKQIVAGLQTVIDNAVEGFAAKVPAKLGALPFGHQSRSVEERSLDGILSLINQVPVLSSVLSPVTSLLNSLRVTNGAPLNGAQEQALSKIQSVIAEAAKSIESHLSSVHIEHSREEHEDWAHHHHDPESDDHHSHDDHKDDHKSQDVHADGHRSPDMRKENHSVQNAGQEDDHCREPRDGHRDERHGWDDWKHHEDGKDKHGDSSLLNIDLGHSCRP